MNTGPASRDSNSGGLPSTPAAPSADVGSGGGAGENKNPTDDLNPLGADPGAEVEAKAYGINEDAGDAVRTVRDLINGG